MGESPGINNELALPCYNRADAVYRGQLAHDQTMAASTINPATEASPTSAVTAWN
ncbi:MAG TPA: hypothetical protein VF637_02930 [Sphingomicrobium sp.]